MRRVWISITNVGGSFCATFLCYLVVGGLLGFVLEQPPYEGAACLPYTSVAGVLQVLCASAFANALWLIGVEIQRSLIVMPALAIALLVASIKNGWDSHHALNAIPWIAYSLPIVLMSWAGFRQLHQPYPIAAFLLIGLLAAQILYLAWNE
jgi:hypothetical protein